MESHAPLEAAMRKVPEGSGDGGRTFELSDLNTSLSVIIRSPADFVRRTVRLVGKVAGGEPSPSSISGKESRIRCPSMAWGSRNARRRVVKE